MPHPWHFPAGRTNLAGPEGRKRVQAGQVVLRREAFYTQRDVDSFDPVAAPDWHDPDRENGCLAWARCAWRRARC